MLRRSQLYVPGNNEEMIRKSVSLNSDSVVIDLEDSVPRNEKEVARMMVTKYASELDWGSRELCVRVGPVSSDDGRLDLKAMAVVERIDCFVIPKAEGDYSAINRSTGKKLMPLIESAIGLLRIESVVRAGGVVAVGYGAADLASSVGGEVRGYLDNNPVKTTIAVTAGAYGVDAVDNVFFDLADEEEFRRQAAKARALGFVGKQVIHPSQVALANSIFSPSPEEVVWAEKVLAGYEQASAGGSGALRLDDQLVDAVHYRLATRLLERRRLVKQRDRECRDAEES